MLQRSTRSLNVYIHTAVLNILESFSSTLQIMSTKDSSVSASDSADAEPKKSWYRRYQDAKSGRNNPISDEDLKKYTGKTKEELNEWSKDRPHVGGNRNAGSITAGPASGFGGMGAAGGLGGWGPGAKGDLKFPPQVAQAKTVEDEEE
ncbi:hypothetical protein N0V93_004716 [Gnomoniopsis smithogilvyi]|uniref:Uncharacterized protein n=1 Tax=Gnomoniopsis smithogilvyi TaxID=1191159 RepID=A0A9W9CXF6_9PEZI|nr:hypothetical protein N0V93_004716 [Gnomoniopsis smithogilvyi]